MIEVAYDGTIDQLSDPLANLQTWVVIHSISLTGLNQLIDGTILRLDLRVPYDICHFQAVVSMMAINRINTIYISIHYFVLGKKRK